MYAVIVLVGMVGLIVGVVIGYRSVSVRVERLERELSKHAGVLQVYERMAVMARNKGGAVAVDAAIMELVDERVTARVLKAYEFVG